jgi:hypothetical protein
MRVLHRTAPSAYHASGHLSQPQLQGSVDRKDAEPYPGSVCTSRVRNGLLVHTGSGYPEPRLQVAADARRTDGAPQTPQTAAKGPEGCGPRQSVGTEGAQGPQRRGVPGDGIRPARGGATLHPRLAAGRVHVHRHGMWWSTLNAAGPGRRCPRPRSAAYPQSCIRGSKNRPSTYAVV